MEHTWTSCYALPHAFHLAPALLHKRSLSFPRYSPTARRDLAIISLKFSLRRKASIVMDADSFRPPVPLVYDSRTILVDLDVIQQ